MSAWLVSAAILAGAFFLLVAALGVLRMPDVYTRMSCNIKAAILGLGLLLVALIIHFAQPGVAGRALAVLAFVALTVPASSHLLGRAAYRRGIPLWEGTRKDELRHLHPASAATGEEKKDGSPPTPSRP